VTHRPAVLDLVTRVAVVDAGKLVMDGPKAQALAALSGNKPAQPAAQLPGGAAVGAAPSATPTNVHLHPAAQPVQRQAAV
jgi:ATP-binding cassette subfamily C protein LapB